MVTGVHAEISLQEKEYETPTLLAGYLDRIGKGKLLTPREERAVETCQSRRRARLSEAHREESQAGCLCSQEVPRLRFALRGPHPGGQHRPYEGCREV